MIQDKFICRRLAFIPIIFLFFHVKELNWQLQKGLCSDSFPPHMIPWVNPLFKKITKKSWVNYPNMLLSASGYYFAAMTREFPSFASAWSRIRNEFTVAKINPISFITFSIIKIQTFIGLGLGMGIWKCSYKTTSVNCFCILRWASNIYRNS